VRSEDPEAVEAALCKLLAAEKWTLASDTLILHGRRICRPKPLCDRCAAKDVCAYFKNLGAKTVRRPPSRAGALRRGKR
jgi:endonuclease III